MRIQEFGGAPWIDQVGSCAWWRVNPGYFATGLVMLDWGEKFD